MKAARATSDAASVIAMLPTSAELTAKLAGIVAPLSPVMAA
jgi:hypothetical protein